MKKTTSRKSVRNTAARPKRKAPRNHQKLNYLFLLNCFLITIAISGSVAYALATPSFAVKQAKIEGVRLADKALVQKAANAAIGKNTLVLKKSPIISDISKLAEVKEVKMGRCFPDGVWLKITERKADAILTDKRGFCMVQEDGLMFHKVKGPVAGIPLVEVAKCDKINIGKIACSSNVCYALEVIRSARREGLRISKISVDPKGDMCLNMSSDLYVKLGQPDDIARKMSLLRNTLVYKPSIAKEAVYVDLSCPSAPVWKPKQLVQASS